MRTDFKDGKRIWTNEAIAAIMDCSIHNTRSNIDEIEQLLSESLQEAGFKEVREGDLLVWGPKHDTWSCFIRFIKKSDHCTILMNLDGKNIEEHDVGELIFLWDKIRKSWKDRDQEQ